MIKNRAKISFSRFVLILTAVLTICSCESFDAVKKRISSTLGLGKGVPLSEFKADRYNYFPRFLDRTRISLWTRTPLLSASPN